MAGPVLASFIEGMELEDDTPPYRADDMSMMMAPCSSYCRARQRNKDSMLTMALLNFLNENPLGRRSMNKKEVRVPQVSKDGFQVSMDVAQFKPSELNVKVMDNSIVIEGKHEEREDQHGFIQRHFVRRYVLPKGYDADKVVSSLSSDGVLTVSAPNPQIKEKSNERIVQIQQTGPAHMNVKQNPQEKIGDSGGAAKEVGNASANRVGDNADGVGGAANEVGVVSNGFGGNPQKYKK